MASGDNTDSGESMYGYSDDDNDCMYNYDDDDNDEYGISDAEETTATAAAQAPYVVLTEDQLLRRHADATAKIAEVLSIPAAFAAVLLWRYKWVASTLEDAWFFDSRCVHDAGGLPADVCGGGASTVLGASKLRCTICFDWFPAGKMRSAACRSHFYCEGCWREYIHAVVADDPLCLSRRCPDPACTAAIVMDLVGAVADDMERYTRFAVQSYVEESGGRIKWCPGPGCACAVEFTGGADNATNVFCLWRHGFGWRCGEEAHRPVSCATVRAWLEKNKSDSESANWVLTNTKHCPKCRRSIDKNQGWNHIRRERGVHLVVI